MSQAFKGMSDSVCPSTSLGSLGCLGLSLSSQSLQLDGHLYELQGLIRGLVTEVVPSGETEMRVFTAVAANVNHGSYLGAGSKPLPLIRKLLLLSPDAL